MMTRSNFNALALNLFYCRPNVADDMARVVRERRIGEYRDEYSRSTGRYEGWWKAVCAVADECEDSNPSFNRGRFIKACEHGI